MAEFGHEAESIESGGVWQIAVLGMDDEAEHWLYLLLTGPLGAWASFAILQNRRGHYYWLWEQHEFGHTTKTEPRRSFTSRILCLRDLWDTMRSCQAFGGLIEDMEAWE